MGLTSTYDLTCLSLFPLSGFWLPPLVICDCVFKVECAILYYELWIFSIV